MNEVRNIEWHTIEDWIRSLDSVTLEYDAFLGIARGGVPIAVALSYLYPDASLFFATRIHAKGPRPKAYEFDKSKEQREEIATRNFELPTAINTVSQVLIVDDVATTGSTVNTIRKNVLKNQKIEAVDCLAYAADINVLNKSNPHLLDCIKFRENIDNSTDWLSFPWYVEPRR